MADGDLGHDQKRKKRKSLEKEENEKDNADDDLQTRPEQDVQSNPAAPIIPIIPLDLFNAYNQLMIKCQNHWRATDPFIQIQHNRIATSEQYIETIKATHAEEKDELSKEVNNQNHKLRILQSQLERVQVLKEEATKENQERKAEYEALQKQSIQQTNKILELQDTLKRQEQILTMCTNCKVNQRSVYTVPCAHVVLCSACYANTKIKYGKVDTTCAMVGCNVVVTMVIDPFRVLLTCLPLPCAVLVSE
jgi:hypothetical protein